MSSEPSREPKTFEQLELFRHLDHISSGAMMCARHAAQLATKIEHWGPELEDLRHCESILTLALDKVRGVLADLERPPGG